MNEIEIREAVPNTKKNSLNIGLPKQNTFFTIDPYTSILQYNESLQALQNNGIDYTEYISLLAPRNWYLSIEKNQRPIMINYDNIDGTNWTKLVSKTKPLTANDIYLLYRRGKKSDIGDYIENDWLRTARKKDSIVFIIKNKEETLKLSKMYGIIYPIGVYLNGGIKLAICFNKEIKNSITPDRIKLEMGPHNIGDLEVKINYKILRNQDKIQKWTRTPYFKDGKFYPTSPMSPLKMF